MTEVTNPNTALPALTTVHRDIEPLERFAHQASMLAKTLIISGEESLQLANNAVVDLTAKMKIVKDRMDFFTKPIKQHIKLIDGVFKSILDPLSQANEILRAKIVQYRLDQQEAQRQIRKILEEGRDETGTTELVMPVPPTIEQQKSMRTDNGATISASQVWDFTIENTALIPIDLLRDVINTVRGKEALESVIRGRVKSGVRTIPGVRIYPSEQLSVRG